MAAFPAIIEPKDGRDIIAWGRHNCDQLRALLDESGAVLLRGFDVQGAQAFSGFMAAATAGALPYTERSSPRRAVIPEENVYTSTQYPADHEIFMHNEQSYNSHFPMTIAFCCLQPAAERGETPIADTRKIYRRLSEATRAEFHRRKYLYVRNYDGKFGLPWTTVFQVNSEREVEEYCSANDIEFEWRTPGSVLTTRQVREVVAQHPRTKELCWFNHAAFFHFRSQEPEVAEMLLDFYGDERKLPHSTYYGDGDKIPTSVIDEIRSAYLAERVAFKWEKGDVCYSITY